ncbi:MAG: hypothetical protein M1817_002324 [Caeruleum heppii]|nr:MAG: hypothetical protein M1817_003491 [Caeruleum heppii]KAI9673686.1 MAG: hypothetical protein M1817_002324 [Caeruleum heppii]
MATTTGVPPPTGDTMISVKVAIDGSNRKFKFPLRDLGANVFPAKLRSLLGVPQNQEVLFERFSDSSASFIPLDSNNPSVYKQLYRAAKAKLKLRIKATVVSSESSEKTTAVPSTASDSSPAEQPVLTPVKEEQTAPAAARPTSSTAYSWLQRAADGTSDPVRDNYIAKMKVIQARQQRDLAAMRQQGTVRPHYQLLEDLMAQLETEDDVPKPAAPATSSTIYAVYCNHCDYPIPDDNDHYHCSICDDGDFDLCQRCVSSGALCQDTGHWLIKRYVRNGTIINSTTETIAPRSTGAEKPPVRKEEQAFEPALMAKSDETRSRTCNACVEVYPESRFVTCTSCPDYDICLSCLFKSKHGHHPAHAFEPATPETNMTPVAAKLCQPGRGKHHAAICDGCDKDIRGVRHKCLDCPNWDYCSSCMTNVEFIHPGHRFAPVYDPLPVVPVTEFTKQHFGVICDGALCATAGVKHYIMGDRYKCTVCPDTDFCASCEASPSNGHNKTHPLIKFKTPVKGMSVAMVGEKENGRPMPRMGDYPMCMRSFATGMPSPAPSTNAATQVHSGGDHTSTGGSSRRSIESFFQDRLFSKSNSCGCKKAQAEKKELNAEFVEDSVADGTKLPTNHMFTQVWTLRNPGPVDWPAGCSVKFVGGDNMRDVDSTHPFSVVALEKSIESNLTNKVVPVGGVFPFEVKLRTPKREGKCISYWRLVGPDGSKFGHKLWCDVDVRGHAFVRGDADREEPEISVHHIEHADGLSRGDVPKEDPEIEVHHLENAKKQPRVETELENEQAEVMQRSSMIFPKLDKEASAPAEVAKVADKQTSEDVKEDESSKVMPASTEAEKAADLADEVASLDLEDESEDAFFTDDEYDILDASDEEFLVEAQKAAPK